MVSTDPGSDEKSQSTRSVEIPLEKDSDDKGGISEQISLNRNENDAGDPAAVDVKFESGTDEIGNEDMDEFVEVIIEMMPDLGSMLGPDILSGTETTRDADITSFSANCKSETAAEEKIFDKVEWRGELVPAEKCISGYSESIADKCISGDVKSVDIVDIPESSQPVRCSSRLECADYLPSVADESAEVNISLDPVNTAARETTDIDASSKPLQNNNNATNNRFLNVVPLADGSLEILLDSGAWGNEGLDQECYFDIEFPVLDEQGQFS